jgi:hypothetical protein
MTHEPTRLFLLKLVDWTVYSVEHPDLASDSRVRRPRNVAFHEVADNGKGDDYETRWIDVSLMLDSIIPMLRQGSQHKPSPMATKSNL